MNAVFDTNIIIDALNGVVAADTEYTRYERVFISRITWMEVLVGAPEDDRRYAIFSKRNLKLARLTWRWQNAQ